MQPMARVGEMVSYEEVLDRSGVQQSGARKVDVVSYDEVVDHTKKSFEMKSKSIISSCVLFLKDFVMCIKID